MCYSLLVYKEFYVKGDINMKKIIAIVLCVALLATIMAISVSAFDPHQTNTSMSYLPVFEDFFNIESIFTFIERIFSALGMSFEVPEVAM